MFLSRTLIFLGLAATSTFAAPAQLETRDTTWSCRNPDIKTYSQNKAEGNMNYAPLTDKTTGSSYPHWFTNGYDEDGNHKWGYTVITFGNSDCDAPPKHKGGSDDHYLLEFPTFPDGHEYNYNSKFPKDDPGPARVIFTYPHKTFCGIVSHTMGNLGDLKLCDH